MIDREGPPDGDESDEEGYDQDIVQQDTLAELGMEQDTPDQDAVERRLADREEDTDE